MTIAVIFIVMIFIIMPILCVLATLAIDHFRSGELRRTMRAREKHVEARSRLLDERAEILKGRDRSVSDREVAVTERERELRRGAKEAAAAIQAVTDDSDDTIISLMEWQRLPEDDTVVMHQEEGI